MPASKVRADYEQLTAIAQAFGQQAESAQQMLSTLRDNLNTLQGGDWVGKGADKFYVEMNTAILPAIQRLTAAMNLAASATTKISRIMKQAEDDAAALFRLDGGNGASGLGAVLGAAGAVGAAASTQAAGNATSESQFDETAPNVSAWGPTGGGQKKGKIVRVEHSMQKKYRRRPPGRGAYTEAEYQDWLKRHPNATRTHAPTLDEKRTQKKAYTPEELWWKGYYYAKTVVDEGYEYEVWLGDEGEGKVLEIYVKVPKVD